MLSLEIPAELAVFLEAGVVHDLTLAVAFQAEGRYYLFAADSMDGITIPADGLTLAAAIHGGTEGPATAVEVRFHHETPKTCMASKKMSSATLRLL